MNGQNRSILILTLRVAERPSPFVAVQLVSLPSVPVVNVEGPQPLEEATPVSGSLTVQLTVALPLFQPLAFGVGVTAGVIVGADRSDRAITAAAFRKYFGT